MLCCISPFYAMDIQPLKKQRFNTPSQNFLLATLLKAFTKDNYTMVEDLLTHISPDAFDINLPLTHKKWEGRVIFNVIHNEYVRRHSKYYPLYQQNKCYAEFVHLYDTFCEIFKDQININIKDTDPSSSKYNSGKPWDLFAPENGSTPLMYIINRLLACEQSIKSIKNIFIEFLQRFGTKELDCSVTNRDGKTIFDLCALQSNDSENIREKKEYIHAMLNIMTRKIFINKMGLHKLDNCHFRFIQQ